MLRYLILFFILIISFYSCTDEEFSNSPNNTLEFSSDTIYFDSLFTEQGSTIRIFKIYNNNKGTVRINKIYIESDDIEFFINVNGVSGKLFSEIDIASHDSLYIFAQAKFNSNNSDVSVFHKGIIKIEYNTHVENIVIGGWGQDVTILKGQTISTNTIFSGKKPYLIYDSLVIAEGASLTITNGTKIYMHTGSNIIARGDLFIQGSSAEPIVITSSRLEEAQQLLPGQWGSIITSPTCKNIVLSHAVIKNGINGFLIEGDESNRTKVTIQNSEISNMTSYGIRAVSAEITCSNSFFIKCATELVSLHGGKHTFTHNTFFNSGNIVTRKTSSSIAISDYFSENKDPKVLEFANFYNSIIVGDMQNEIIINPLSQSTKLQCIFDYCLLKQTYTAKDAVYYTNNIFYDKTKPLFAKHMDYPLYLDSLSQAQNKGLLSHTGMYTIDKIGNSRIVDTKPDLGAIEYMQLPK